MTRARRGETVTTYPIATRRFKVRTEDFAAPPATSGSFADFWNGLPRILVAVAPDPQLEAVGLAGDVAGVEVAPWRVEVERRHPLGPADRRRRVDGREGQDEAAHATGGVLVEGVFQLEPRPHATEPSRGHLKTP